MVKDNAHVKDMSDYLSLVQLSFIPRWKVRDIFKVFKMLRIRCKTGGDNATWHRNEFTFTEVNSTKCH